MLRNREGKPLFTRNIIVEIATIEPEWPQSGIEGMYSEFITEKV
jgi:hypothetical protein